MEMVDWIVNLLHSTSCTLEVVTKDVLVGLILKAVKQVKSCSVYVLFNTAISTVTLRRSVSGKEREDL